MLRTRLWMGALLILLVLGVLLVDPKFAPHFPILFVLILLIGLGACRELVQLLGREIRLPSWLCYLGVTLLLSLNWVGRLAQEDLLVPNPWSWLYAGFTGMLLVTFAVELWTFQKPGQARARLGAYAFIFGYLGVLPSFLVQLRWLPRPLAGPLAESEHLRSTLALALALFTPKVCDIGAYFTGRLLGKHRMSPTLSPKKTWEGFVGGLVFACALSLVLQRSYPLFTLGWLHAGAFGLTVGLAGVVGDLAESLLKRDAQEKDASQAVPGFGGVLDVIDSVLYASPIAYFWLTL